MTSEEVESGPAIPIPFDPLHPINVALDFACAPGRPARARAILSSVRRDDGVRRANRSVSPSTCSTNVRRLHSVARHRSRRTRRSITTFRPATARSDSLRRYPLWTRPDAIPHPGQTASPLTVCARTTTSLSPTTISSTATGARWEKAVQSALQSHEPSTLQEAVTPRHRITRSGSEPSYEAIGRAPPCACSGRQHIVRVSKTAYAPTTPRSLVWKT